MRTLKQLYAAVDDFWDFGDGKYEATKGRLKIPVELTPDEVALIIADIDKTMREVRELAKTATGRYIKRCHGNPTGFLGKYYCK